MRNFGKLDVGVNWNEFKDTFFHYDYFESG